MLTFVWDTPKFRKELESRFDDFCLFCGGTAAQLKVAPKDTQVGLEMFVDTMAC